MIISGNRTGILPFLKQLPASYMDPLEFSFDLTINGIGTSLDFGLSTATNIPIINYSLRSGLVYDYSGRFVATYQSGNNNFQYNYTTGQSWQSINGRLISVDPLVNYTGNPFERFYVKNTSAGEVDFDLIINGFAPPSIYTPLVTQNLTVLTGQIIQSGLDTHPGQGVLYQIFGISVPSGYGSVNYFQSSGTGGINYTISGGSYSPDDVIPVTFNTYWGEFTQDLVVSSSVAGETGAKETGVYLSLYGGDNLVSPGGSLNFFVDYYSNGAFPVTIELSGSGASSIALLSGTGAGYITYQGNVFGTGGTIFSDGMATGVADLFATENLPYNTQHTVLDQYLNITAKLTGMYAMETPFIGQYTVSYSGVEMNGTYDGPNASLVGKTWRATGDVSVVYTFTEGDNGVIVDAASYPGFANPIYSSGKFMIQNGTNYVEYPYNAAMYPTGEGFAYIDATVTGQGLVTITEPVDFFGYGYGRVASGATYVPATGTGYANYTGYISEAIYYYDYYITYPDAPVYPEIEADPDGIISGGAIVVVKNQNYIGRTNYLGQNVVITGVPTSDEYTWGYPTGPAYIHIPGYSMEIVEFVTIPQDPGLSFVPPSGDPVIMGFTGEITGYLQGADLLIAGPVFPDPRDTGLYPYGGNGGLSGNAGTVYGRGCIFGGFSFSYASVGLALDGSIPITFEIKTGSYVATYEGSYTDVNTPLRTPNVFFPQHFNKGGELIFNQDLINVQINDQVFSGWARVPTSDIATVFNMYEGVDEDATLENYVANNWIAGDRLVRPSPQIFGSGSDQCYLRVNYLSTDENSVDVATLRVTGPGYTGEVRITGGSDGVR